MKSSSIKHIAIIIHTRQGLLPAVRFHQEDFILTKKFRLSQSELERHMEENDGFLSLDFIFEKEFKENFIDKQPEFYEVIKDMRMEQFVNAMMEYRKDMDPFSLFKFEYAQAEKSIEERESICWKEMLAVLSFTLNYPAKHMSAEDRQRLENVLMPLISIVIAFVPQSSCEQLFALHEAGRLEIVSVGDESEVEMQAEGGIIYHYTDEQGKEFKTKYETFIDCIGQKHLPYQAFPFKSLSNNEKIMPATLRYRSNSEAEHALERDKLKIIKDHKEIYHLIVPGHAINDSFQVIDRKGKGNSKIYLMAVSFLGGHNPDYSGLDFCEEASKRISSEISLTL